MFGGADKQVDFRCDCGEVQLRLSPARPSLGTHLICHCRDCRAAHIWLDRPDPGSQGVTLFQTSPDLLTLVSGGAKLAYLRLGPRGPLRWYARCCRTPLVNTLARPGLAFCSLQVAAAADAGPLGKVRAHAFLVDGPDGAARHRGGARLAWGVISRMVTARVSGRWKMTPFFDPESGEPVGAGMILTQAQRASVTPA